MPFTVNETAAKTMKEIRLPSAKPGFYPQTQDASGNFIYGEWVEGETNTGNIPMKQIPHMDFPKTIYQYPRHPWKARIVMTDGHGNKEWQWIAVEAKSKVVADAKELKKALEQGWNEKPFIQPEMPAEDPEPKQ